ncbi:glucoselysine-6-phosphate deglycase [Breznakia sp. PF5-3]|uniref:SIS domain-containing protein n=1 Tax=unclassified Breznakia TaxID=2623764 RepID=UPI002406EA8F|nr:MULTISPECIES: SIS domain-containing protein [unclassified Breznakia]MDF9824767.1 glucoselysine-6-phosphate deglycase [Breznakia sp. PM6-1]MDF9835666.1 glucoselysine-6-phosphate deglycase [Breznakia sp. PF5-3]MDF9837715.1 glucoselysine-6-phosphate deglycase [Breznakia sp. PFB2-8]MDF9859676.1 glucoselysine-6-phosphate deglycase [Breznakia sp. PH5-24]
MTLTMENYIYGTPKVVLENLKDPNALVKDIVDAFCEKEYKQIMLVASGSSYTAAHCARTYLKETLQIPTSVINPYTFTNYDIHSVKEDDFVLVISQSGASTNCIDALQALKDKNMNAYVLTSDINSDAKKYATKVFDWGCGIETVGFVTLGVVTLIVYLQLFAAYSAKRLQRSNQVDHCLQQIKKAMKIHKEVCDKTEVFIEKNYKRLMTMDRVYVMGCGSNYGSALEGALKIGEAVKVLAVGYEQDEFLHGPALQLSPKYTAFVVDNNDHTSHHAQQVYKGLCKVSDNVFMITPSSISNKRVVTVENTCEEPFSCLYYLPFFELIAAKMSKDLNSTKSHPLYYEMNKVIDFRTKEYRKTHKEEDE